MKKNKLIKITEYIFVIFFFINFMTIGPMFILSLLSDNLWFITVNFSTFMLSIALVSIFEQIVQKK